MDLPPPIADALASFFPVIMPQGKLLVTGARSDGDRVRASAQLVALEGDDASWVVEQEVDLGPSSAAGIAATAARVRERLATLSLVGALPAQITRESTPFRRVPRAAASDPRQRLEDVRDAIREQAKEKGFDERFEVMGDWPIEPRIVYFLDLAYAMLGGNGLETFLDQAPVEEVEGVLFALDRAGSARLAGIYREALAIIAKRGSGVIDELDPDWLAREKRKPRPRAWKSWAALDSHEDGGTYALMESELRPRMDAYMEEHRTELEEG